MHVLDVIGRSLADGGGMFWQTLWALVLGFGLSGAVQAFVSRAQMQRALGDHRPATIIRAGLFGAISSSCSYAASALAKTLFARGADFTAAQAFMFASTNLVAELGTVLWLLIGWQFAAAEFAGGALMITLLALVLPRAVPPARQQAARQALPGATSAGGDDAHAGHGDPHAGHGDPHAGHGDPEPGYTTGTWRTRIRSAAGWSDAAGYTISDLTMLRGELLIGFVVAGFADAAVPASFWRSLFLTGPGLWPALENVVLGPFLAIISFVCSIGNVPLAAALWTGGLTFGGTIAFVFADLITLPLLLIYRRYYGTRLMIRMLALFWAVMATAGLITEGIFRAAGLVPKVHPTQIAPDHFSWNYTTYLNFFFLVLFGILYWAYRNRERLGGGEGTALDPVCGMQVEKANAPASTVHAGARVYFCSDRCRLRYEGDPARFATDTTEPSVPPPPTTSPIASR